ncbi:PD-(D/E)XK nuclease family transposase [Geobacillus thermoleovorans]|uniref:PD-(D/E)XK nuclease family transposase n=1 Tax=Geobacillus thermoleovorans TaxID=33941 RepID=UPI003DA2F78B
MSERLLYYWARLFSSSLLQGQRYAALPPTIMIVILGVVPVTPRIAGFLVLAARFL